MASPAEVVLLAARKRVVAVAAALCALEVLALLVATRVVREGLPASILADLVSPLLEAVALAALVAASRRATGRRERRFFAWMALATLMGLAADASWAFIDLVLHEAPLPSVADAFSIGGLVLVLPALVIEFGSPLRHWRDLIDVSIAFCALVFAGVAWLIRPQLADGANAVAAVAVTDSTLAVIAAIATVAVLRAAPTRPPASVRLVAAAVVVQASSWLVWAYAQLHGAADTSWVLTGRQATWALLVVGSLSAIVGGPQEREVDRRRVDGASPALVTAGLLLVLAVIAIDAHDGHLGFGALGTGVAVVVIVVLRLQLMTRERGRLARTMRTLATTDALTGVPNRRGFDERLTAAAAAAAGGGPPLGLLIVDVDRFKVLNDAYGHPLGDEVLRALSARLAGAVRGRDLVARIGGEEFAVVACGVTEGALRELAERCRRAIASAPIMVGPAAIRVTISVGGACLPGQARTPHELMRIADGALYLAKQAGRDRVHVGAATATQEPVPLVQSAVVEHLERLADGVAADEDHGAAVVTLAARLCDRLGVTVTERRRCLGAARLRDVGAIATPPSILPKRGPLTPDEVALVREHVRVGVELLASAPETRELAPIVAEHHEQFDGGGYPAGKRGLVITIEARIIAVADAWAAMLADRPHRPARTADEARRELRRRAGTQFDPRVVTALLELLDEDTGEAPRHAA